MKEKILKIKYLFFVFVIILFIACNCKQTNYNYRIYYWSNEDLSNHIQIDTFSTKEMAVNYYMADLLDVVNLDSLITHNVKKIKLKHDIVYLIKNNIDGKNIYKIDHHFIGDHMSSKGSFLYNRKYGVLVRGHNPEKLLDSIKVVNPKNNFTINLVDVVRKSLMDTLLYPLPDVPPPPPPKIGNISN